MAIGIAEIQEPTFQRSFARLRQGGPSLKGMQGNLWVSDPRGVVPIIAEISTLQVIHKEYFDAL